jgi:hypothetical protein
MFELLNLGDISIVSLDNPERTTLWNNKDNSEILQNDARDYLKDLSEDQLELLESYILVR